MIQRLLAAIAAAIVFGVVELALWLHRAQDWAAGGALAAAACVPLLAHAAILGQQFAIGAWLRRRSRPDLRPGLVAALRAWSGEIVASLRTFGYAQIRYASRPLPSGADAGRVPVLLVHGYFCNRGIWHAFARRLAARGHPLESVNLEPVFGPIDDYVPVIAAGIERLRARTGAARIAVVAHSMGGLAVRAFIAARGGEALAAVVTLGTPHRGTWLARYGYGRNVAQMRLDSDWLRALADRESAHESARAGVSFTVILSLHDNMVAPQTIQTLEGARTIELTARGHVELAYDRDAWARTIEAIDTVARSGCPASTAGTPSGPH